MKTIVILLAVLIVGNYSLACSCQDPGTVQQGFEYSDMVVHGTVLSRSYVTHRETMKREKGDSLNAVLTNREADLFNSELILKVELKVSKVYKGEMVSDTVVIYTGRSSAACGFSWFKEGEDYIIYGTSASYAYGLFTYEDGLEQGHTFWTNHCTRTTEYNEQEAKELEGLMAE